MHLKNTYVRLKIEKMVLTQSKRFVRMDNVEKNNNKETIPAYTKFLRSNLALKLEDNCIQICHLGRYIVEYTVGNFVLRRRVSGAVKHDTERISDDIPPRMTILNIPILMYFYNI